MNETETEQEQRRRLEAEKRSSMFKTPTKSIQFDLKSKESRGMLLDLVEDMRNRSMLFTVNQDFNLIWVEL